jgi:hypothetical protein
LAIGWNANNPNCIESTVTRFENEDSGCSVSIY